MNTPSRRLICADVSAAHRVLRDLTIINFMCSRTALPHRQSGRRRASSESQAIRRLIMHETPRQTSDSRNHPRSSINTTLLALRFVPV